MNCPLCLDQTLAEMHRNGIELDVCPKCKGIWLDRGEIDKLAADRDTVTQRSRSSKRRDRDDDDDRDDDRDDDDDRNDDDRNGRDRKKKRRKKKSLADRLGDAIEHVLDF